MPQQPLCTAWVFQSFEPRLWTVGFYDASGKWHPESDHDKKEDAAKRVNYLNGGDDGDPKGGA